MFQIKEAVLSLKERFIGGSVEKSLEDATSNTDNLNVPTRVLHDLAARSYNPEEYDVILKHIWQQLGSSVDKWRRILKTLNLVEYMIKNGSPRFVIDFREEIFRIRLLTQFTHKEDGEDKSASIVETSVRLNELLENDDMIDQERRKADVLRERLKNLKAFSSSWGFGKSTESSSGVQKYDGFSSKDADLFLRMSSKENEVKTEEKTDESLEKVPPENYMRDGDMVIKKDIVYNIDLTEDPSPAESRPQPPNQEINLLDIDILPARVEHGLRDVSNLDLNNKAQSANTQIWEWDQQVYNKYTPQHTEQKDEEFDWSKASQNENHSNFSNSVPNMYNRSVSLPEGNLMDFGLNTRDAENNGREISLI